MEYCVSLHAVKKTNIFMFMFLYLCSYDQQKNVQRYICHILITCGATAMLFIFLGNNVHFYILFFIYIRTHFIRTHLSKLLSCRTEINFNFFNSGNLVISTQGGLNLLALL